MAAPWSAGWIWLVLCRGITVLLFWVVTTRPRVVAGPCRKQSHTFHFAPVGHDIGMAARADVNMTRLAVCEPCVRRTEAPINIFFAARQNVPRTRTFGEHGAAFWCRGKIDRNATNHTIVRSPGRAPFSGFRDLLSSPGCGATAYSTKVIHCTT